MAKRENKVTHPFVWAWDRMMGSLPGWMRMQQKRAAEDNAPHDAIYERDGEWVTYGDIESYDTKRQVWGILRDAGYASEITGPEPELRDFPKRYVLTLEIVHGARRIGIMQIDVTEYNLEKPLARAEVMNEVCGAIKRWEDSHG